MKKRILHKRALSLIEILITFALSSIIITLLFTTYKHSSQISAKLSPLRERVTHTATLHKILFDTFSLAHSIKIIEDDHKIKEIQYIFNNGIDPNPNLSSEVCGSLQVNNKKELYLYITPLDTTLNDKREVFLTGNINSISAELNEKNHLLNLTFSEDLRFAFFLRKDYP